LNEFRAYLGLKTLDSFEEWNPDPEIANAARQIYGHIDDLELYPGLLAEVAKPPIPGSGVCPNQTIGRGILDDAVSLVRSDRFLTYDLNTATLTSWGLANLKPAPGARGGYLPALILKTLPEQYEFNSVYALLPFYTPDVAKDIFTKLGCADDYSYERTAGPGPVYSIKSFDACKTAFEDRETYATQYNQSSINQMTDNRGFFIGFDLAEKHDPLSIRMLNAFYGKNFDEEVTLFFKARTEKQIKKCSISTARGSTTKQLDIVRDVCNFVPIEWIANRFGIPIKSVEHPGGLISIPELHMMLLVIFVFSSFNIIPKNGFGLREFSLKAAASLTQIIAGRISSATGFTSAFIQAITRGSVFVNSSEANEFYRALSKSTTPGNAMSLAGDCLGIMIPLAGNITQQLALLVELYLRPEYDAERQRICELVLRDDEESEALLSGYIHEGMRIAPVVVGLPRTVTKDTTVHDGTHQTLHLKQGHKIVIGIARAHMDPAAFPDPQKIDPTRPAASYILFGVGLHHCFGTRLTVDALKAGMRSIFSLKNLRRAPGPGGQFVRYKTDIAHGIEGHTYLDQASGETPAPVSLQVWYDDE
jgi:cytochrome P450